MSDSKYSNGYTAGQDHASAYKAGGYSPHSNQIGPLAALTPILWLKADSIAGNNGDAVGLWSDSSGHGNDAIMATSSRQPILSKGISGLNGNASLFFDGSNVTGHALQGTFDPTSTTGMTVFYVARTGTSAPAVQSVFNSGQSLTTGVRWQFGLGSSGTQGAGWAGAAASPAFGAVSGLAANTTYFARYRTDKTQWTLDGLNTNTLADTSYPTGTFHYNIALESLNPTNDYCFNGYVGEILVYTSALSTVDLSTVKAYLKTKWGLP